MEPKKSFSRRKFVQTSAGVVAAGALLGKRAFAAPRPLKIGYVSPETGGLAPFGEADKFVVDQMRKTSRAASRPVAPLGKSRYWCATASPTQIAPPR